MSKKPRFLPATPTKPRDVLIVLFEKFQILDAAGPIAAFEIATRFAPGAYRVRVAACGGGLVRSSAGVAWPAEDLKGLRASGIDTLIVAGGIGTPAARQDAALLGAVRRISQKARRTASVCSGAFILAAAGLLDGKRATTHWRQARVLQAMHPETKVERDAIWTRDGAVWTSAGVSAGMDLALALIAEDHGAEISKATAREMVIYAQRPGGQTQHSAMLDLAPAGGAFVKLSAWMRAHVREDLSVERLAAQAAMSPRTFARRFAAETGMTPAKAVERLRLETARAALEAGRSVQEAALDSGFLDGERMRRAFIRHFGSPPSTMRRTLRHA